MSRTKPWISECFLKARDKDDPGEYICFAAVFADSYERVRGHLSDHLQTTLYRLEWIEEALGVDEYIHRHGPQAKITGLARAVHAGHLVALGPITAKGLPQEEGPGLSFRQALLALDYKSTPVFAVLDGAQFDNLPKALFDGDFIARSLYLDRGENDPEQIITAPHMVVLDERSEKITGRAYEETLEARVNPHRRQACCCLLAMSRWCRCSIQTP